MEGPSSSSSDLVFVLHGGERVLTKHKTTICNMSEVVKKGLERQEKESERGTTAFLNVADLGQEEFKTFDKFLSTGTIPSDLKMHEYFKLMNIAKIYEIVTLFDQTNIKIRESMRDETVFQVLQGAKYQDNEELYSFAVDYICQNPLKFIFTEEFRKLGVTDVHAILDSEKLNLEQYNSSEQIVLKAAEGWVNARLAERKPEVYETFSYFLEKVIDCVRLPLLEPEIITKLLGEEYSHVFEKDLRLLLNAVNTGMKEKRVLQIVKDYNIKWWLRGTRNHENTSSSDSEEMEDNDTREEPVLAKFDKESQNAIEGEENNQPTKLKTTLEDTSSNDLAKQMDAMSVRASVGDDKTSKFSKLDETPTEMDLDEAGSESRDLQQNPNNNITTPTPSRTEEGQASPQESAKPFTSILASLKTSPPTPSTTPSSSFQESGPAECENNAKRPLRPKRRCRENPGTSSRKHVSFQDDDDDTESSDSSDLFSVVARNRPKAKYNSYPSLLVSSCKGIGKENKIGTVELKNFKIKQTGKIIPVAEGATVTVEGDIEVIKDEDANESVRFDSVLRFARSLNVMDYLVFRPNSLKRPLTEADIWGLKQEILISLNGITFLKINHKEKEVVTNYLKNSAEIIQGCVGAKSVAVSNCQFNLSSVRSGSKIEKLNFYRVWGDFTLCDLFVACPNLRELRFWKWKAEKDERNKFPKGFHTLLTFELSNPSFPFNTLKILKIVDIKIILCKLSDIRETVVEELRLETCHIKRVEKDVGLCQILPKVFPRLKRLTLKGEEVSTHIYDAVSVHSVVGAAQIPTLEWLRCIDLKWEYTYVLSCNCDVSLSAFFQEAGVGESTNFLMEREIGPMTLNHQWQATGWKVTCLQESEEMDRDELADGGYYELNDKLEFDDFELEKFFADTAAYENYFLDNIKFPQPISVYF